MRIKAVWGVAVCLIAPICAGCAVSPDVIRGQSPVGSADRPAVQQAVGSIDGGSAAPAPQATTGDPGVCPECGCRDGSCGHHCIPRHALWYHYCPPQTSNCCLNTQQLSYPANPTPGAVVQYPYYTCKGPDDFFYNGPQR